MDNVKQHARIKAALALRGLTFTSIATDLGVSPTAVAMISKGRGRSQSIERAIAAAVRCTPAQLWPGRYSIQEEMSDASVK